MEKIKSYILGISIILCTLLFLGILIYVINNPTSTPLLAAGVLIFIIVSTIFAEILKGKFCDDGE